MSNVSWERENRKQQHDRIGGLSALAGHICGNITSYSKEDGVMIEGILKSMGIERVKAHLMNVAFVVDADKKSLNEWEIKLNTAIQDIMGGDYSYTLNIW